MTKTTSEFLVLRLDGAYLTADGERVADANEAEWYTADDLPTDLGGAEVVRLDEIDD